MAQPAGDELECRHAVHAGIGAIVRARGQLDLGAHGVVGEPRLGDRSTGAVTRHAQHRLTIVAGDRRADVGAEPRVRPGEQGGGGVWVEPAGLDEPREHGALPCRFEHRGIVSGG